MSRRYGYKSVWEVEEVVANYSTAGLPLEAIWTDVSGPPCMHLACPYLCQARRAACLLPCPMPKSLPLFPHNCFPQIDHMDGWRDFTFHQQHYPLPEMQRFVAGLHARGQRWVPIVDPGIKVSCCTSLFTLLSLGSSLCCPA